MVYKHMMLTTHEQLVVNTIHNLQERGIRTTAANIKREAELSNYYHQLLKRMMTKEIIQYRDGQYVTSEPRRHVDIEMKQDPLLRKTDLIKAAQTSDLLNTALRLNIPKENIELIHTMYDLDKILEDMRVGYYFLNAVNQVPSNIPVQDLRPASPDIFTAWLEQYKKEEQEDNL